MTGGGGHGPLSSRYGLGADNLLSATVVLPDSGEVVTVSACEREDLFRAIRGGSPTFGVVVDATFRAYDSPKTVTHSLTALLIPEGVTGPPEDGNLPLPSEERISQWWRIMAESQTQMEALKKAGLQGYYTFSSPPSAPAYTIGWGFYGYDMTTDEVDDAVKPFSDVLAQYPELVFVNASSAEFPNFNASYNLDPKNEPVAVGNGIISSRLLPPASLESADTVESYFNELRKPNPAGFPVAMLQGLFIAPSGDGSAMHPDAPRPSPDETGVPEEWRTAVVHFISIMGFPEGLTQDQITDVNKLAYDTQGRVLADWATEGQPEDQRDRGGSYFNEGDSFDPDRKDVFWGSDKYDALLALKHEVDPRGVMWCRGCVGAEEWVDDYEEGTLCPANGTGGGNGTATQTAPLPGETDAAMGLSAWKSWSVSLLGMAMFALFT